MMEIKITSQLDKDGKVIDKIATVKRTIENMEIDIKSKTELLKDKINLEKQIILLNNKMSELDLILKECDKEDN